jgi:hypothetical protein
MLDIGLRDASSTIRQLPADFPFLDGEPEYETATRA